MISVWLLRLLCLGKCKCRLESEATDLSDGVCRTRYREGEEKKSRQEPREDRRRTAGILTPGGKPISLYSKMASNRKDWQLNRND